jgi:hypothetical protein
MKAYRESGSIAVLILDLDARWRFMGNLTTRPFYPQGNCPQPIEYEAGWAPQPVWAFWRRQICHCYLIIMERYTFGVIGSYFLEENNQVEVYTHNNSFGGIATGIWVE